MHVIEQPLPPAPAPEPVAKPAFMGEWIALYDAHTEIAYLMLGSMTSELHRKFELYYLYDMIQELRSMFEKQLENVEELERLGYMLPQDISTIGEIHAMLIEYEKGLPKKAETPQVIMIKSGKIQKANKKSLNAKGKNKRPTKDDADHRRRLAGHWKRNCPMDLAELQKKGSKLASASSSGSIMYAVRCTRPDVAFAQNMTSPIQQKSGNSLAVKNILTASEAAMDAVWIRKFMLRLDS
ncbi:hypothetical protein Tco_1291669 [Tanacetum coccineum]